MESQTLTLILPQIEGDLAWVPTSWDEAIWKFLAANGVWVDTYFSKVTWNSFCRFYDFNIYHCQNDDSDSARSVAEGAMQCFRNKHHKNVCDAGRTFRWQRGTYSSETPNPREMQIVGHRFWVYPK